MSEQCGPGPDATFCPTFWSQNADLDTLRADLDTLRALVAEILRVIELGTLGQHSLAAAKAHAKTAEWRQRAGLEPAMVGAGAEHIAAELAEREAFLADAATLDSDLTDGPARQRVADMTAEGR